MRKQMAIIVVLILLAIIIVGGSIITDNNLLKWIFYWSRYHLWADVSPFDRNNGDSVKIVGGFEASNIFNVKEVSKNHFKVMMRPDEPSDYAYPNHMLYWFYLKITGAKDQRVTIDITNAEWMPSHWDTYKPVYTYSPDPNDLNNHKWEKITNTNRLLKTFSFTHTFTSDTVWVALRYPYTYTYGQRYISSIKNNPYVTVETIGKAREGRNIDMVMITDKSISDKGKKGVWLIAKEHAIEQDCAWVVEGIIEFLLSEDPKAIILRKKTVFMLIPVVAPDAAYHGRTVNPVTGFDVSHRFNNNPAFKNRVGGMTEETRSILDRLHRWKEDGHSLDVAVSFHNPHGGEENVWGMFSGTEEHKAFHGAFLKNLNGYSARTDIFSTPIFENLFPGRMVSEFGSIGFIYEINQHAKGSFLTIKDLHNIGEAFAKGVFDYFNL